jgi:hypothetical protein
MGRPRARRSALVVGAVVALGLGACNLDRRSLSQAPIFYPDEPSLGGAGVRPLAGAGGGGAGAAGLTSVAGGGIGAGTAGGGIGAGGAMPPGGSSSAGSGGTESGGRVDGNGGNVATGGHAGNGASSAGGGSPATGGVPNGATGGAGGTSTGTGGVDQGGTSATGGAGATAGQSSCLSAQPPTGGVAGSSCADLDFNQKPDCLETLVRNSTFDVSVTGWRAEPGMIVRWDELDALTSKSSGSIAITNPTVVPGGVGFYSGAATQCTCVAGGGQYYLAAQTYLRGSAGAARASVALAFYASDDCSGDALTSSTTPTISFNGAWLTPTITTTVPVGAQSALLRLVVSKNLAQDPAEVMFDNILLKHL